MMATLTLSANAQRIYEITAPQTPMQIVEDGLKMGGRSPKGGSIAVNNYYMSIDGRPVVPVMGEFHYSRYPHAQWEEQILKMKAGGVNLIPTYVFWNIHEEKEGQFDWTGDRDLRHFIELCGKHGISVIVRIGPFDHGEIRNGGFPDWLFTKPLDVRSDDPLYLHYTGLLYDQIAQQLKGLYYKDGGPIIGIQIENEHQHSAAAWAFAYPGEAGDYTASSYDSGFTKNGVSVQDQEITTADLGNIHMQTLLGMARERGMVAPIYTATGWGNAAVLGNKGIPVTSGYPYPVWGDVNAMSPFCLFKDIHADPDYSPVRYNPMDFPSFSVELGAGIQIIYDKRPVINPKGAEAMIVRCLGGGANAIGYYMYQGGSSPLTRNGQGFLSDGNPKVSYDFQAPLGEFGLEKPSYRSLRLLHSFLADWGADLAPLGPVIPDNQKTLEPADRETLRYAARMDDRHGYLFLINFQDHDGGRHAFDTKVTVNLKDESIDIPVKLAKDEVAILPFNMHVGDALLKYATAQPLMKLERDWFFFAPEGMPAEYVFDDESRYTPDPGFESAFKKGGVRIWTLTRSQAEQALKVGDKLLFTDATVVPGEDGLKLLSLGNPAFGYTVFDGEFRSFTVNVPAADSSCSVREISPRRVEVAVDAAPATHVREYFLSLDYTGDIAAACLGNRIVADHLWQGTGPWLIGLDRFGDELKTDNLNFYIRPLRPSAPFLGTIPPENVPSFDDGEILGVSEVEIVPQYMLEIQP